MVKPWHSATFLSLMLYGLWGFWGAKTSVELGARSALFYSAIGTMVIGLLCVAMMHFKPAFTVKGMGYGMLTGAATGIGTLFFIAAIRKGPAVPVVMITALYPMITTVLLLIFANQTITTKELLGICFSLIGLMLLV